MINPHGGILVNQILTGEEEKNALLLSQNLPKIVISGEQAKEVKNIARGLFSPLTGFMNQDDLESVASVMRLKNGVIFPLPVFLAVTREEAKNIRPRLQAVLIDGLGRNITLIRITDIYTCNKTKLAQQMFGTTDRKHPGVKHLLDSGDIFLGGDITLLDDSKEPYPQFNLTPLETRALFAQKGWKTIAGFQTRNVPHLGHEYLHRSVLKAVDGLFIHPVIGIKKPGDFKDDLIVASYQTIMKKYYPKNRVAFAVLPYQMRYAGPKEAVLHAIIRKNFGCTHFIVGRDHAGVGSYYDPYDAQRIFEKIGDIDINIIPHDEVFYCKLCVSMATVHTCHHTAKDRVTLSGTYIRSLVTGNKPIPSEIMRPEVSKIIRHSSSPFI